MTVVTKAHLLRVVSRAYGPEQAESMTEHLPDPIDLNNAAQVRLLFELGLTPDGLFDALGAEL
jgi:hypothetical protein